MSNINLLPWRQQLRDRQRSLFYKVIGTVVVVAAGISALGYMGVDYARSQQESQATYLKGEIQKVDQELTEIAQLKTKKQELIDRMNAIDSLQQSRNIAVHLYSDLPTLTATGLYLNSMSFSNRSVNIKGLAESNPRVSSMLRNIDNSKWLGNSYIAQTKAEIRDGKKIVPTLPDGLYEFDMKFSIMGDNGDASNNTNKGGK
jgi:type IV pilus assembly protein PilN